MTDRIVQLTEDYAYREDCSRKWYATEDRSLGWVYVCQQHNRHFPMNQQCDGGIVVYRQGETVTVPAKLAESLVRSNRAVYPTHHADPSDSVKSTLDRVNAMLEADGLPTMDAESMGVISVEGRRDHYGKARRPVRPRDSHLASDLGLDPSDIADMRNLAKGSNPS